MHASALAAAHETVSEGVDGGRGADRWDEGEQRPAQDAVIAPASSPAGPDRSG
jgi:hypothetical protein